MVEQGVKYTIVDIEYIKSYHYHGSFFEHTWLLTAKNDSGEVISGEYRSWDGHNPKYSKGDIIEFRNISHSFMTNYIFSKSY